uniref:Gdsl-like lipase acylhydrolase n=1 Tax=Colletotrichum fructicola (strain Nara gc5) TaxID=1213859 RepID=L2FIA5_COLFN
MKAQTILSALLPAMAMAAPPAEKRAAKPPAFYLAGDSTTAKQSEGGGGWGNGFLSFLKSPAKGTNYGVNGRTTVDYVSGGYWATVKKAVTDSVKDFDVYVTIQFGHNDQKPEKNISLDQYQANLGNLAKEIKALGATPILVTPLTRRSFSNGVVTNNLFVQAIGEDKAHSYNLKADDNTHLNAEGSVVFGRLVADLVLQKETQLASYFNANKTLSDEIWKAINSSTV